RVYGELAKGERRALSVVFEYGAQAEPRRELRLAAAPSVQTGALGVALLGAGNYAKAVLLPALRRCDGIRRVALATATGGSARRTAERFAFETCGTDPAAALSSAEVGLVFVATRHDSHAALAVAALRAGKAVWLEKPVGLSPDEVDRVIDAARETGGFLA